MCHGVCMCVCVSKVFISANNNGIKKVWLAGYRKLQFDFCTYFVYCITRFLDEGKILDKKWELTKGARHSFLSEV